MKRKKTLYLLTPVWKLFPETNRKNTLNKEELHKTTCCYCGVGCGIIIKKDKQGRLKVEGDSAHPVNKGMLCSKGMNLHYTAMDHSDRILHPQMRMSKSHPMKKVTWQAAIERTANVFKTLINKYGPDSIGFYISGQCLTEEYYIINKLVKGFINTNNIDTNSRLCMSSAVTAYKIAFGEDSVPLSYDDIELADCFLIAGANPAWCHPILFRRLEAHKEANPGIKIIVVDPRATQSCSIADIHLQINPGTDIILFNAIGRTLIEKGFIDSGFINNHTTGFETYKEIVFMRTAAEAASICGIPAEDITAAAEYIGRSSGFISFWAMGLNQSVIGVNKNLSLINLSLITGKVGKEGSGPFSLTGQPNAMGGREVGGLANLLSNHRSLDKPEDRKYVQEFWGSKPIKEKPGLTATEMFAALAEEKLKAIWIICTNPMVSLPDLNKAEEGLSKAKFVVVQDISGNSDTIKFADVILPAAGWMEKEGTMTNSERRISYLPKVIDPPGEALPDAEIIKMFADKMGFGEWFNYTGSSNIFDEHCKLSEGTNTDISALSYSLLKNKGTVQWPFINKESDGAKRLFTDYKFPTLDGKARIISSPGENLSERTSPEFPLILTTGRIRDQWHTMTRTGKVNKLNQHAPEPMLEINPDDAVKRNIIDNSLVEITGRRGSVRVKAKVTSSIKNGVVFLPMHWGRSRFSRNSFRRANNITNNLVDDKSKEPDFKFSAVEVKPYKKPPEKILIIGAGAAAYSFVKKYRELNSADQITVFSKEINPFYNRILLPDYISGEKSWGNLLKEINNDDNIILKQGICITKIDKELKMVYASDGLRYSYDKLLLCTGSRPNVLKNIPRGIEGIFYIRTKEDADRLKSYTKQGKKIIIIGGGLLGLEIAGSLNEKGVLVTVVHRASRLMDKQLDITGSRMLEEMLTCAGINIICGTEAEIFYGRKHISGVKLKNGSFLDCDALVTAAGTIPEITLAKEAGLEYNRGVIITEQMQTSDPDIYAAGEIAEFNGILYGTTSAAEEQAHILAGYIAGDINTSYRSSLQMNILKIKGIDLCSMGLTSIPPGEDGYEEIIFLDKSKNYYKKCIVHKDYLVGAVLIGDKDEFVEFKELISKKIELSEKRLQLLRSSRKTEVPEGEIVCSCNSVGIGNLKRRISAGVDDINELILQTTAGTGCGSCLPEIKKILKTELVEG